MGESGEADKGEDNEDNGDDEDDDSNGDGVASTIVGLIGFPVATSTVFSIIHADGGKDDDAATVGFIEVDNDDDDGNRAATRGSAAVR